MSWHPMTISEVKHKPCQHTLLIWGHSPRSCLPSWSDLWTQLDAKEYVISVIPTLANTSLKQQSILHQPLSCWIDEHPPCAHRARELGPLPQSFSCLQCVMLCYQAVHKNTWWHTLSFHVCIHISHIVDYVPRVWIKCQNQWHCLRIIA